MLLLQILAGSGGRGYLDGSLDPNNWIKLIRSNSNKNLANMRHLLVSGQVGLHNTLANKITTTKIILF